MSKVISSGLRRRVTYTGIAASTTLIVAYKFRSQSITDSKDRTGPGPPKAHSQGEQSRLLMAVPQDLPPWEATFAVPMHCQACVDDIEATLRSLQGITALKISLEAQTITVTSTLPPSTIQRTLASAGRDAILRGSGLPNSAAVAILETYAADLPAGTSPVRGLVRMVQVRADLVLCDVGVSNLNAETGTQSSAKGLWAASVRSSGDLSHGAQSTGAIWDEDMANGNGHRAQSSFQDKKGFLGTVEVDASGKGAAVLLKEQVPIWELIGRGLVLEKLEGVVRADAPIPLPDKTVPGSEAVVGVIARSAGVWDNDKTVCSCSGKTVWEEREEQRGRGML